MAALALFAAWLVATGARAAGGWVLAGLAVSIAGGVVLTARLGAGQPFNHNDWFHVLQAIALVLYAVAAYALGPRPSSAPEADVLGYGALPRP
jgi:hypothetical protein